MKKREPVLSTRNLVKTYPGVLAVNGISIDIYDHEIVGLVGENGAGKSTLLKLISGVERPDSGSILLYGKEIVVKSVAEASRYGIGMVFQEQSLLPNISVAENILLGRERTVTIGGVVRRKKLNAIAQKQLDRLDTDIAPTQLTGDLSFTENQLVEIARALAIQEYSKTTPIILLDEPTSALEQDDAKTVLDVVRKIKDIGSAIFVSHRLEEVLQVSDRIYVFTNGECIAERDPKSCEIKELQSLMLGKELEKEYIMKQTPETVQGQEAYITITNLSCPNKFTDFSINIREGEIIGLAGVVGSGREEICRAIFGIEKYSQGSIKVRDDLIKINSPEEAIRSGIGYLPADRRKEGIIKEFSIAENMTLAHLNIINKGPLLKKKTEQNLAQKWTERLGIKTPSINSRAGNLSGGNQQKLILAKWILGKTLKLFLLDRPMRGLDVGAKVEVMGIIRNLASDGISVLLIGDTLEEMIAICGRIITMKDGKIVGEYQTGGDPVQLKMDMLSDIL
jgi:ribose transport system ATP-binding protein